MGGMLSSFPGLYRPGLIEGCSFAISRDHCISRFRGFTAPASLKVAPGDFLTITVDVSGALPPRPH